MPKREMYKANIGNYTKINVSHFDYISVNYNQMLVVPHKTESSGFLFMISATSFQ